MLTTAALALAVLAGASAVVQDGGAAQRPGASRLAVGRGVGQVHPDLELPTIDGGRTVRLSELRGRKVLLIEFASW